MSIISQANRELIKYFILCCFFLLLLRSVLATATATEYSANMSTANVGQVEAAQPESLGYQALYSGRPVVIDGELNEIIWQQAVWYPIDYLMAGKMPDKMIFTVILPWHGMKIGFIWSQELPTIP